MASSVHSKVGCQCHHMILSSFILQSVGLKEWDQARFIRLNHALTSENVVHGITNTSVNLNAKARRGAKQCCSHAIYLTPEVEKLGQITCGGVSQHCIKFQANWLMCAVDIKNAHIAVFLKSPFPGHVESHGTHE